MAQRLIVLTLALFAVLAAPLAGAAQGADIEIDVYPDREPTTNASSQVTLEAWEAGERYNWTVDVSDDYDVVDLRIHEGFNVTRAKQLVPLIDGKHFVELTKRPVEDVDQPAKVFNLTTNETPQRYRLGLPGPGERNLSLHRDVAPPAVALEPVRNVTHVRFDAKTSTSEPAMADLVLEKPDGSTRELPTPRPGVWQRFPVHGLKAETTYSFHVRAWDWSGNEARTNTTEVTTQPAPNPPKPIVRPVRPMPNETIDGSRSAIVVEASLEANGSAIIPDGISFFFDKERVDRENLTIEDGTVRYSAPGPLQARPYSVAIEVPNEAGGTGVARWTFHVEADDAAQSPIGVEVGLLTLGLAGLVAQRRRAT